MEYIEYKDIVKSNSGVLYVKIPSSESKKIFLEEGDAVNIKINKLGGSLK